MKFYEFGNKENLSIMLLPGTCCHWKNNFNNVIDLLKESFYVICVSYDGFDENEKTEFPDMIKETEKIEDYIQNNLNGNIHAIYGCSLGGSFVGLLMQRRKIHMNHGILGSSDLDQTSPLKGKLQTKLLIPIIYRLIKKRKTDGYIMRTLKRKKSEGYVNAFLNMILGINGEDISFVSRRSMENQFYYDLITKLDNDIEVKGTNIHCLYAAKMGELYLNRYKQHFKNPDIIEHNLEHEELLACKPKEWVEVIKKCIS